MTSKCKTEEINCETSSINTYLLSTLMPKSNEKSTTKLRKFVIYSWKLKCTTMKTRTRLLYYLQLHWLYDLYSSRALQNAHKKWIRDQTPKRKTHNTQDSSKMKNFYNICTLCKSCVNIVRSLAFFYTQILVKVVFLCKNTCIFFKCRFIHSNINNMHLFLIFRLAW